MAALGPPRLLYVSCDVSTFARDVARLRERGYTLEVVQPLDCLPQTYHLEVVARLTRQAGGAASESEEGG